MTNSHTKHPKVNVGDRFYNLEVIAPPFYETYPNGRKRKKVLCRCICGKEKTFLCEGFFCKVETERTKSCGCMHIHRNTTNSQKRRRPESVYRYLYEQCKSGSKSRNIPFKLSKEEHTELIQRNCYYCGDPPPIKQPSRGNNYYVGVPVPYNGVDRVDSDGGYVIENCVPCCTLCNWMKTNMKLSTFTEHILKISNNLQLH